MQPVQVIGNPVIDFRARDNYSSLDDGFNRNLSLSLPTPSLGRQFNLAGRVFLSGGAHCDLHLKESFPGST